MAKQEQQRQKPEEQFSDPEMEGIKQYGEALGGKPTDFEEEVERHLSMGTDAAHAHEASYAKMRAAQEGGPLGPSDIEKEQVQQSQAQAQTQATQQAAQAGQAQAQQSPVNAPPAPSGPTGVSTPYEAQNAPQPPPSAQDVEPEVPGMQSPASHQPPPAPDQGPGQ